MFKSYRFYFVRLLALFCASDNVFAARKQARLAHSAFYVGSVDAGGGAGFLPLLGLSESLAAHPAIRCFRINWQDGSGSFSETGTVLYDRSQRTLEYSCKGDHNAGYGLTVEYLKRAGVRDHFLFTQVSPTIITKAGAAAGRDYISTPLDAFNSLSRYGCHKKTLRCPG